eukprot:354407-Pyramimonas_sp.AAC.1
MALQDPSEPDFSTNVPTFAPAPTSNGEQVKAEDALSPTSSVVPNDTSSGSSNGYTAQLTSPDASPKRATSTVSEFSFLSSGSAPHHVE